MHSRHRPRRRRPASSDEIARNLVEWRDRQAREVESDLRRLVHLTRGGRTTLRSDVR